MARFLLWGAFDVEPQWSYDLGYSGCTYTGSPESQAMDYVDGWNSREYGGDDRLLYDIGWLDEVSYDSSTHTPTYPCGWSASEVNKLNWSGEAEGNFLEEYDASWPSQLEDLDLYSYYNSSAGSWYVPDVLGGGEEGYLDDDTAWSDVLSALNSHTVTSQSTIDYLSDQQDLY